MISSDRRARWRQSASRQAEAENIPSRLSLAPLSFDSSLQSPCPSMAAMSVSSPSCACVCVIEREREVLDYCFSRGLTTKASTFGNLSTPLEDGRPVSGRGRVATAWHGMAGRGGCGDRKAASSFVLLSCLGFAFARSLLAAKFVLGWIGYWIYTCSQQRQQRQAADWSMCVSVCQLTVLTSHACVMHPSGWVPPPTTCMPCRCRASQENGCQIIYIFSRR